MDSNLNVLETKVLEAIDVIKGLRAENESLLERVSDLEAEMAELREANQRMNTELEESRANAGNLEIYEEKRKEIEDRVGGLLAKLEGLG